MFFKRPSLCKLWMSLLSLLKSDAYSCTSHQIQNIQLEREMALASNRSLAERNLDMKPKLEQERERLVERYSELEEVRDRYKQRCTLRGKPVVRGRIGVCWGKWLWSRQCGNTRKSLGEGRTPSSQYRGTIQIPDTVLDNHQFLPCPNTHIVQKFHSNFWVISLKKSLQ